MSSGYRNCNVCTRWRPISDFPPKGRWVAHTCRTCRNRDKRQKYENDQRYRNEVKQAHREHQAVKRRERGVPVRPVGPKNKGKYGAGRIKPQENSESKKRWREKLTPEQFQAYRDRENKRKRKGNK